MNISHLFIGSFPQRIDHRKNGWGTWRWMNSLFVIRMSHSFVQFIQSPWCECDTGFMCFHIPLDTALHNDRNKFECHLANIGCSEMNCTTANSGGQTHQCIDTWNYEFNTIKPKLCESIHNHPVVYPCICILFIIFSFSCENSFVHSMFFTCCKPLPLSLTFAQLTPTYEIFLNEELGNFHLEHHMIYNMYICGCQFRFNFPWIYTQTDQFSWSIGRLVNSAFNANVNGTTGE